MKKAPIIYYLGQLWTYYDIHSLSDVYSVRHVVSFVQVWYIIIGTLKTDPENFMGDI